MILECTLAFEDYAGALAMESPNSRAAVSAHDRSVMGIANDDEA